MTVSNPIFTKHLVRSVPPRSLVPVQLIVGDEQRLLEVNRPRHFTEMTLLSSDACSKQTAGLGPFGPRTLVKRAVSQFGPPIQASYFFDTRFIAPNNISHMLMEIIPLCLCVKSVVGDATFVFHPLLPRFRELLSHFGIAPLCTYRPVRGKQLTFRFSRGLAQFEIGTTLDAPIYSYTGEVYSEYIHTKKGPSKIFISRRGPRSPVNVGELNSFLDNMGFTVVYLEDYSISEQIALIQCAEHVVAIHGAAIAFLALKDRTRTFIELLPPNIYHDHFPVAIGHKVENFFQLIPSFNDNVQFAGWAAIFRQKQQPFSVDLKQLKRALDSLPI